MQHVFKNNFFYVGYNHVLEHLPHPVHIFNRKCYLQCAWLWHYLGFTCAPKGISEHDAPHGRSCTRINCSSGTLRLDGVWDSVRLNIWVYQPPRATRSFLAGTVTLTSKSHLRCFVFDYCGIKLRTTRMWQVIIYTSWLLSLTLLVQNRFWSEKITSHHSRPYENPHGVWDSAGPESITPTATAYRPDCAMHFAEHHVPISFSV